MELSAFHQTIRDLVTPYYKEPHRFYHTVEHVQAMLDGYEKHFGEMSLAEYIAIMYHDAIYNPWSKNNEEDSIQLMLTHREVYFPHISKGLLGDAGFIILDTKHTKNPLNQASERVIDLDLMILGKPWSVYEQYVTNTRKEYCKYSDEEWKIGRTQFLESMIASPRIFNTDVMHSSYDPLARINMSNELAKMK